MNLAEVLRVGGRRSEAVPVVEDALRRYERKEVLPAAVRARALLDELSPSPEILRISGDKEADARPAV